MFQVSGEGEVKRVEKAELKDQWKVGDEVSFGLFKRRWQGELVVS